MNNARKAVAETYPTRTQRLVLLCIAGGVLLTALSLFISQKGQVLICNTQSGFEQVLNRGFPFAYYPELSYACATDNITATNIGFSAGDIPALILDLITWSAVTGLIVKTVAHIRRHK